MECRVNGQLLPNLEDVPVDVRKGHVSKPAHRNASCKRRNHSKKTKERESKREEASGDVHAQQQHTSDAVAGVAVAVVARNEDVQRLARTFANFEYATRNGSDAALPFGTDETIPQVGITCASSTAIRPTYQDNGRNKHRDAQKKRRQSKAKTEKKWEKRKESKK